MITAMCWALRGAATSMPLPFCSRPVTRTADGKLEPAEILEFRRRLNGDDPAVIQSFREAAGFDQRLSYSEFIATLDGHDSDGNGLSQEEWDSFAPVLGPDP